MKQELVKFVEKPWGYEKWIAVTDQYAMKEIFLKKGCRCSLQYHNEKEEHSYLLSGKVSVEALAARHAELAAHLTAHLRRYAYTNSMLITH